MARTFPKPKREKGNGKILTVPNLHLDIKQNQFKLSTGQIEDRVKGYYEKQGYEIPDFDRLDKIGKIQALSDMRKKVQINEEKLKKLNNQAEKAAAKKAQDDRIKAEQSKQQDKQPPAGTN